MTLLSRGSAPAQTVTVDAAPDHQTNAFSPLRALGSAVDRDPDALRQIFSAPNLQQMLAAGWGALTYRLNTELYVQAWHWNPQGTWSGPAESGYFTGDANSSGSIAKSFGYNVLHRGFTISGEPASALDDGESSTYWKSNPYLTSAFTHDGDGRHPQWVFFDLGAVQPVNAAQIAWAAPYATDYQVQYWTGGDAVYDPAHGVWQTFPAGTVTGGQGGTVSLRLSDVAVSAQYIRVFMTASSNTCDTHGPADLRNCVGYAIGEIGIGTLDSHGDLTDLVAHSANADFQTPTYCSSDDPWHQAPDIASSDGVQPGLDFVFDSPLTGGMPMVIPVSLLYGTPEDATAEIAYLERRKRPIGFVEMGEEPDGQFVTPEDYAELYLQWAAALHRLDPALKLGGPVFQGANADIPVWPDEQGNTSWFNRFLNYLNGRGRLQDLSFMSFEHYPFNPCNLSWDRLYKEPSLVTGIMKTWRRDGLPAGVPMLITESNISYDTNSSYMSGFGALWLADYMGSFLNAGGQAAYYYQYEPLPMYAGCQALDSWGTFGMFTVDGNYQIVQQTSQFDAARLLTREWAEHVDMTHYTFPASVSIQDQNGDELVTSYAVLRPDGKWSLLLINKDQAASHDVGVVFQGGQSGANRYFAGPVSMVTFSPAQYGWHQNGAAGFAAPDTPLAATETPGGPGARYALPAASVTVLRGEIR